MQVSEIPLKGAHNLENVLAAVCAGALMGCAPEKIRQAVRNFKAVEHRLEFVATIRGVDYYNDSKATNVDATIKALESFPANIHLILGGKDKGSDYTVLNDLLRERVKRVYTIGAAAAKIESQIKRTAGSCPRRDSGKRRPQSRMPWRSRETCVAGSGLRQLRPVQELRTPRASLQGNRARSLALRQLFTTETTGGTEKAKGLIQIDRHTCLSPRLRISVEVLLLNQNKQQSKFNNRQFLLVVSAAPW